MVFIIVAVFHSSIGTQKLNILEDFCLNSVKSVIDIFSKINAWIRKISQFWRLKKALLKFGAAWKNFGKKKTLCTLVEWKWLQILLQRNNLPSAFGLNSWIMLYGYYIMYSMYQSNKWLKKYFIPRFPNQFRVIPCKSIFKLRNYPS